MPSYPAGETTRQSFGYTPRSESGPQLAPEPAETPPPPLPADAVVDLADARKKAGVDEVMTKLDCELVGLTPVKTRIAEIAALLLVDRMRARYGVTAPQPTLHMCFTGIRVWARPPWHCGWPICCIGSGTCAGRT
jgi:hypothetical protein